jgi:hypothetical protein
MTSDGMIYIPGFMKIGRGVQTILRFGLSNLMGCNVDITEPIFMKLDLYTIAPEPIPTAHFINPTHQPFKS